jgi:hypothetical protein
VRPVEHVVGTHHVRRLTGCCLDQGAHFRGHRLDARLDKGWDRVGQYLASGPAAASFGRFQGTLSFVEKVTYVKAASRRQGSFLPLVLLLEAEERRLLPEEQEGTNQPGLPCTAGEHAYTLSPANFDENGTCFDQVASPNEGGGRVLADTSEGAD